MINFAEIFLVFEQHQQTLAYVTLGLVGWVPTICVPQCLVYRVF